MYKALSVTLYRTAINVSDNVFQSQLEVRSNIKFHSIFIL